MSERGWSTGRCWLLLAGLGWAGFLGLTLWLHRLAQPAALDLGVLAAVLPVRTPLLTSAATGLTLWGAYPGIYGIAMIMAVLLWGRTGRLLPGLTLLVTVVQTGAVVTLTKHLMERPRPPLATMIGAPAVDGSFPSGHTTSGSVVWVLGTLLLALTLTERWTRVVVVASGVAIALLIGATRIYLGYHWTTDVVGGWLLTLAFGATAVCFVVRLTPPRALAFWSLPGVLMPTGVRLLPGPTGWAIPPSLVGRRGDVAAGLVLQNPPTLLDQRSPARGHQQVRRSEVGVEAEAVRVHPDGLEQRLGPLGHTARDAEERQQLP